MFLLFKIDCYMNIFEKVYGNELFSIFVDKILKFSGDVYIIVL